MEELYATLNQIIPSRSKNEWIADNPEIRQAIVKRYTTSHREQINEKSTAYYYANRDSKLMKVACDCGGVYCKVSQSRHVKTQLHKSYLHNININEIKPNDII